MKKESLGLRFLYHTFLGRFLLKIICCPFISKVVGVFLTTSFSKIFIKPFIRRNHIKIEEYEPTVYKSFNDFFSRKILSESRPIDRNKNHLISPCDGFLSVYKIKKGLVLPIKQSEYSVCSLLKNEELARIYQDGVCVVLRLCVEHYHRYCYIDSGVKEENIFIPGRLHTVRPIALESIPVFIENAREYTVLHTDHFGDVIQMEVGALFVGKIKNFHEKKKFLKGEEKGTFLFGGSTIVLLFKKNAVEIDDRFYKESKKGIEVSIKMGEKIGGFGKL